MERHKYCLRQRLNDHREAKTTPDLHETLKWASQSAEALQFMHDKQVFQVDVGAHNILLDDSDDLKFCDFAGSSIDGEQHLVLASAHSTKTTEDYKPTVETELFALGSLFYEIETAYQPYHEKYDHEIQELFTADVFPDTQRLVLGPAIQKCWRSQYSCAAEALADIHRIQKQVESPENKVKGKDDNGSSNLQFASAVLILAVAAVVFARKTIPSSI